MRKWVRGSCLTWGVNLSSHEWPISLSIAVSFHFTKENKSYINLCKNSFHWKHYNTQWTEIPQYPMYIINQVFKVIYTVTSILNWSVLWASLSGGGIMVSGSGPVGCVWYHTEGFIIFKCILSCLKHSLCFSHDVIVLTRHVDWTTKLVDNTARRSN